MARARRSAGPGWAPAGAVAGFGMAGLVALLARRLARAKERLAAQERFQAHLLPADLPAGVITHYVAIEERMLLGGDFLDAVRTADGGLALLMGDVCGHGPQAAALAARLRASWRTLATAGVPVERLDVLDRIVVAERPEAQLFATVACAHVDAAGAVLRCAVAGHPPVLLDGGGRVEALDEPGRGPALGLVEDGGWPVAEHVLPAEWTLVLYTDGLIEARAHPGGARLGIAGLQRMVDAARGPHGLSSEALLRSVALLGRRGGCALEDDLALLVVDGSRVGRKSADTVVGPEAGG